MERDLAGGIRAIGEFFVDEVLDHMPEAWRSTLIETSILESITGPLAEAVTQRSDAADTLLALSEAGMFVARPPVDGGSFRVHAMLQPLLRSLLREQSSAEEIAQLHLRASEALSLAGHHLAAVEHAHVAQDAELVQDLLGAHGHEILARDPQGLARALRDMRRPEQPLSDLDLYAAVVRADREELEVQATRRPASDTQRAALRAVAQHLSGDATLATSGPQELDGLPPGWGSLYRGMALTVSERYHEGGECLLQAAQADGGNSFLITASLAGLAWNNARAGKLGAARTFAAQALDRAGREHHPWFYATGWARLALAQVAYDQGRLEDAHRLASSVDSEDPLDDGARVESSILYSRVVWAMGDQSTARVILNSGFTGGGGTPITGVLALRLVLANVSLSLMERDADIATTWLPDWEQRLADGPLIPTERLTLAHLLIELDREDESRRLLADPEVDADRSHRSVLESWKLAALAGWKAGDPTAPLALEIAVSMAQAEGFVQMFTESSELLARVGRPTTSGVTIPVGSAPVAMAERRSADRAETLTTGQNVLVEELTEREFAVLRYVPTRLSNREIAEELFVSINTVKSHIKNIYRKLGVTTRRDAVARAVALRLM
jgi:LuxR family maltose regulon positive regulatory protein